LVGSVVLEFLFVVLEELLLHGVGGVVGTEHLGREARHEGREVGVELAGVQLEEVRRGGGRRERRDRRGRREERGGRREGLTLSKMSSEPFFFFNIFLKFSKTKSSTSTVFLYGIESLPKKSNSTLLGS
jgi:hypothetical protein